MQTQVFPFAVMGGTGGTGQRLHSLGNAIENRGGDTRDVGNHPIGGNAGIAGQFQENGVENNHDNAGRDLGHEGRKAQRNVLSHDMTVWQAFCEVQGVSL